jgi:hypothetical protein
MESKESVWKASLNGGIILGLIGTIYTLAFYYMDLLFKPYRGFVWIPILLVMLFILMKQFRDNYRGGFATYGQAFGSGVVISLYYSVIMGIMVYVLYGVIDTDLASKQIAFTESTLIERGMPEASVDMAMQFNKKLMTPAILALGQVLNSFIGGTISSLIIALFVRKEGNPLID